MVERESSKVHTYIKTTVLKFSWSIYNPRNFSTSKILGYTVERLNFYQYFNFQAFFFAKLLFLLASAELPVDYLERFSHCLQLISSGF